MDFNKDYFLISRLRKGDSEAFTFLVDAYHHKLCVYANSLINNHIQAEDVVQNVFINVWEKRKQLNANHSIQSFLYKSVYNEFIDQYRKTQSVMRIEKKYIDYLNSFVIEEDKEKREKLIILVKEVIETLPPKCKQVFELSKKEGLTNIEISEHLEVSIKAVEAQITRAFSLIRKNVKEKGSMLLFLLFQWRKLKLPIS